MLTLTLMIIAGAATGLRAGERMPSPRNRGSTEFEFDGVSLAILRSPSFPQGD
ncbi:hypothetical protein HMPREF0724_13244 [Prescottella equi ATCC 33707]|uniref:Uncharacterized protein n=1 Tax=Prescottella equi ATCC 33707 TaxID=525370 RepID=E9T3K3_RHOHA|nr:hypothetical protein HMPREF0724_13244 [Prescottella equi ATCC 33707]